MLFGRKKASSPNTMQAIIEDVTYVGTPESLIEIVRLSKQSKQLEQIAEETKPVEPITEEETPVSAAKNRDYKQFGYKAPKKNVPYTRIRHERKLKDWTSDHASKQSGLSGAQYGKIENAYVVALRNRQIDISKVYGLPPRELFDYYGRAKLYQQKETSK